MIDFIKTGYIDTDVCDELVDFFEKSPNKKPGTFNNGELDINSKHSTDVPLYWKDDVCKKYFYELNNFTDEYKKEFQYCNDMQYFWGVVEQMIIQKYEPNQGYFKWHYEKTGSPLTVARHLVFMTYLNDVYDGGETEWYYQRKKVQPRKGLTVIWPADWTYTHRGITSPTETKYIITGWYSYFEKEIK